MTKMLTRVWTKPQTQNTIKQLRNSGYTVNKIDSGYECKSGDELIFRAMIGQNSYLVRCNSNVFGE